MTLFDPDSRYAKVPTILLRDGRGRTVEAVAPAQAPPQGLLGVHLRRDGQKPDHLALLYLSDPAGYWRLAERNDAMTAEVLSELREIEIPTRE